MARPNLSYLKNLVLFLFGLPCGMLTGLTGIANSVVVLPLAAYLVGLRGPRAAGVGLATTLCAGLASLLTYQQHGTIRWGLALVFVVAQVLGAAWGQRVALASPKLASMRILWACVVIAIGLATLKSVLMPNGHVILSEASSLGASPIYGTDVKFYLLAFAVVFGVGFLSRLIELGGVLLVPATIFLLHQSPLTAQGTSIAVLLIASLPSLLAHVRSGVIEAQSATWLSVGCIFGGLVGAHYAVELLDANVLIALLGIIVTLLGIQLLWRKPAVVVPPPNS